MMFHIGGTKRKIESSHSGADASAPIALKGSHLVPDPSQAPANGADDNALAQALLRKHRGSPLLTCDVIDALRQLKCPVRQVKPGTAIIREGSKPQVAVVILTGCVFRHRVVGEGKRQIFSFQIAGDIPDLQSLLLKGIDHTLTALDPTTVAVIPLGTLLAMIDKTPALMKLLWRDCLLDAAIFREWIANTGRRRAVSRMAHLLCELVRRAEAVGVSENKRYPLPLTHAHYADALGLSTVHVNRSLQTLRSDGLVDIDKTTIRVLDWQALAEVGDFEDDYLELPDKK